MARPALATDRSFPVLERFPELLGDLAEDEPQSTHAAKRYAVAELRVDLPRFGGQVAARQP